MPGFLGIDCGSVSLNLFLVNEGADRPISIYLRTRGKALQTFIDALDELCAECGNDLRFESAMITGSGRELLSGVLQVPCINEITAHAAGVFRVNPQVRSIIEIGGQDSKFMRVEPPEDGDCPRIAVFRMNEICAAGTGAFLDEQAERLGVRVESFGPLALQSEKPAPIAGRCAVFAKTDMIHQAQEGTPIPDILLGSAFALVRNYIATLVKGEPLVPLVALQGGVMHNQAVVKAFRELLGLSEEQITIPPHFDVMGALGCAHLARQKESIPGLTIERLRERAQRALEAPIARSFLPRLDERLKQDVPPNHLAHERKTVQPPLVMGLDVGSVSVKGVIIDGAGRVVREDYRLSKSRVLEGVREVIGALTGDDLVPDAVAVTGSGRYLIGRILGAELIVNEIIAQAGAALSFDPQVDTVVEIGGQDSKWISLQNGAIEDFEMNRVCAAGTGSFLMAQAHRLDLQMGAEFSGAAFAARMPADLGNRCTVFMESDLIHHQNSGASVEDLAAGVCMSVVQNYLERVANHRPLGERVMFLGGVAATPAVKAAFEQQTGHRFHTPAFFKVSGAFGAALNALEGLRNGTIVATTRSTVAQVPSDIRVEQFSCRGCTNNCQVRKYHCQDRIVFHGGLCERWERETPSDKRPSEPNPFSFRSRLLEQWTEREVDSTVKWGMIRSPQFYEWFPFWQSFCRALGISLVTGHPSDRRQLEEGSSFLHVETCLPMKVLAGQVADLQARGVRTIFHPCILWEPSSGVGKAPLGYCPYIQASSQFFKGTLDLEWKEPVISHEFDADSLRHECARLARDLGFSREQTADAVEQGLHDLNRFRQELRNEGKRLLGDLRDDERALVVLGKPYHTADSFLNMNLGSLLQRLGVKAIPSDLYPMSEEDHQPVVSWKYQDQMIRLAGKIREDSRLFPVLITFFGCSPDPFTRRHIKEALGSKPLLVLEMDAHSSRAGMITRIEAFLEQIRLDSRLRRHPRTAEAAKVFALGARSGTESPATLERTAEEHSPCAVPVGALPEPAAASVSSSFPLPEVLYIPYFCEHSYAMVAAARSFGVDARVLEPPDEESERIGRPHTVGGECHPYVLVLGDYLKLARTLPSGEAERSLFYFLNADACRLGQFSVYIDKVRQQLGLSLRVITNLNEGLTAFGLSSSNRYSLLLKTWEGLNAYDVLMRLFLRLRPFARQKDAAEEAYRRACLTVFQALCQGRIRIGMEEALHELYAVETDESSPKPEVAVTGDYYTRVVPYANNDVYRDIEALGGILWPPPTLSDCFKMGVMRDSVWNLRGGRRLAAAGDGIMFALMAFSEFKVKGSKTARRALDAPLDILGLTMWKTASSLAHTGLPSGMTAPMATALRQAELGADGVLNLMTLNCSYGTVVTAALARALKQGYDAPMLTLIFDGLKKTNEKTRLEAFMEQVWDRFHHRLTRQGVA
ncbi:MAG: hypothetical protein HY914_20790 [Desulfomonile tiedjei]|nr:hypothetical protein [Desulfomonile tiedjei]